MGQDSVDDKMGEAKDRDTLSLESVYQRLQIETKIKMGAENMLQVFDTFQKGDLASKREIELQLDAANSNIAALTREVEYYETLRVPNTGKKRNIAGGIRNLNPKPDLAEFGGRDSNDIIDELISRILKPNSDSQMRSVTLKKFIHWVDFSKPDLSSQESKVFSCLRKCCYDPSRELRALSMRAIRHFVTLTKNLKTLSLFHIEFFIIKFLTVDTKWDAEREQAILLIRTILSLPDGKSYLTDGIIRAVCSIAEQSGDRHRTMCIELLCELLVFNMEAVARSGGIRIIIHSLFDLPHEMSKSVIQLLLALLDKPHTRCFIRPGADFEYIFSAFSDSYERSGIHREKLKACSRLVLEFLRNWNGIMYLCISNKRATRSIVNALGANSEDTRKIILEMFFLLFNLHLPNWNANLTHLDPEDFQNRMSSFLYEKNLSLLDQHYAILLHLLFEAGIIERLTKLIEGTNRYIIFYATILITEILKLSNRLMSKSSKTIQSLPGLFHLATLFKNEELRHVAQASISKIDNANLSFLRYLSGGLGNDGGAYSLQEHKQIEKIKLRIGRQVDDNHFKNMLNDSQVLSDKDPKKWNWEIIMELLQGPLLNAKRLDEALRGSKFIKRMLSFYAPSSKQFSEIRYSKINHLYVQVGCEMLNALMANPEGVKYLMENELLEQLEVSLTELDPINGSLQNDHIFSKERMQGTLTPYYFTLLGALSKFTSGIKILEKFHIFDLYYHVSELRSRDDLVRAVINSLDYRREGHARVILSKVLTSAYKHIRLFATNFLRVLLRKNIPGFSNWGIYLLITQLYDPSIEVCEMAVSVLDEACMKQENLDTLIRLKPSMSHLEFAGDSLLLRYLSSTEGLDYLLDREYVETQIKNWFENRNLHYVTRVELSLQRALESTENTNRGSYWFDEKHESIIEDPEKLKKLDGFIFPHFYGELTKTCKGCEILQEKGHLDEFSTYLKQFRDEVRDDKVIAHLKANLWALGHIGASEIGIILLSKVDVIEDIKWIAEKSLVFSLKGTAVYVLGLIGSTDLGDEVLQEAKWGNIFCGFDSTRNSDNSLPKNWAKIPEWEYQGSLATPSNSLIGHSHLEKEILTAIGNLSNHILANTGSRVIAKIKNLHPDQFRRADLFYEALDMLSHYHFRLTVRQFIFEVFDVTLDPEFFETWTLANKKTQVSSPVEASEVKFDDMDQALSTSPETFMDSFIDGNYSPVHEDSKRLSRQAENIDKIAPEPNKIIHGFVVN